MRFFIIFILLVGTVFGRQKTYDHLQHHSNPPYIPWFTGSLLPPSAVNASPGHPVIAPYLGLTVTYGAYDDNWNFTGTPNTYSINPFFEFLFGINDAIGVDIYASAISSFKKGQQATNFQDTIVLLGFQIAKDVPNEWIPDIRLTLQETLPTGRYEKLSSTKLGIDATGQGSYQTGFNLITQKLFPTENHFLLMKWAFGYLFPTSVHVKGFNTYGGGAGTKGTVTPGQTLYLYFAWEYSLSQRWVIACDTYFQFQRSSTFSGHTAGNPVGIGPSAQLSIAPEVEYNLTDHSGFLFGLWASLAGRNSPAFATLVGAYYIAF